MSWLYSIVFAGLLLSSGNDSVSTADSNQANVNAAVEVVQSDETEKFEQSYPLNANGRVSVSNINGSIVVDAWDRNEVKLEAIKIADSKETLADVEIKVDARPEAFSVEANYDNWKNKGREDWKHGRKIEVQFRLSVPRGAELNEIETVNGSVTVADFVNYTKISAVNGFVKATNLRGTASLSTVNGEVTADFDRLESGSKISLETVNGTVNLVIPSDSSATVKADSVNGNITNDFGLPVRKGKYVGRDLYGRIGGGDVQIRLNSVNGGLAIGRKQDGKSTSPATNLLPQKGADDDEDWDDDTSKVVDTHKLNKEISKAVKESQKEVAIALKEAQKEIARIKPVIAIDAEAIAKAASAIDAAEIEAEVREAMEAQKEALSKIADANFVRVVPRIERKSQAFPVKGIPKVTIDAKGCAVKISGWDKQEVQYSISQFQGRRDRIPVDVKEDHTDKSVNLRVINNNADARNGNFYRDPNRVRIEVFVPKKANLKIITNGEIRLENVSGEIDLTGEDEAINVRDADGKLRVASKEGTVRVIGFTGELESVAGDGDVYLEGDFSKLSAKATDATITVTLPEDANASFSSNTEVETDGLTLSRDKNAIWRLGTGGPKYDFQFADGKLVVRCASTLAAN